jgi:RND family efflux transporter MFP subunit
MSSGLRRRAWLLLVGLLVLVGALALGIMPRLHRQAELRAAVRTVETSVPTVTVMTPERAAATVDLVLPGSIQAIQETNVYARVDGYVKTRLVDIGDRVDAGQLLAEIDTPELDQQLAQTRATLTSSQASLAQARASLTQARATLQQNRSTLEYARTNLGRWRQLRDKNLVAQQDVDDRQIAFDNGQGTVAAAEANVEALQASAAAAEANVAASEANVRRLRDLQSFQKVRAPFGGFITVRNIEQGALIASGSGANTMPMFRLAQIDSLRVFVNVPQTFVQTITPGLVAEIAVRELPSRPFRAGVVSTANSLDPISRTLLTEVRLKNDGTVLRPGMYADVTFHLTRAEPPLVVPSSSIIVRAAGPQVATVGQDRTLRFHKVELGRDFGATIEIVSGLDPGARLVVAPPDDARDGAVVNPVPAKKPAPRRS